MPESGVLRDLIIWIILSKMYSVSFRWQLLQFAPYFRANFVESGKTCWRVHMKLRFKVSSLKLVRFFVNSGLQRFMKKWKTKGQVAVKVYKAKGKYTQIVLSNLFILFDLIWVDVTQLVTTSYWLLFQPLLHLNEMICGSVKDSWNWVFFIPASGRHILHY